MNARIVSSALLPFASAALCGTLAFAQSPAPPAPAQSPAPIERPAPPTIDPGARGPLFQRGPRVGGNPGDRMHGDRMGSDFGRGGMHGMWWRNPTVAQQLSLTTDQVHRMDTILEQTRLQLIDLRANLQKQEIMLEPMLSANPVDTAKASAQIDKVAQARADLEKVDSKMLLSIRGVLTPEQWTKLNDRRNWRGQGTPGQPGAAPPPAGPATGPVRGNRRGQGDAAPGRPVV